MNGYKLWFISVGIIYVLLGVGFIPPINALRIPTMIPGFDAPINGTAYWGLLDFSFMFGLDLLVTGLFMLYASREPMNNLSIIKLIIVLEIVRGICDDIYMITKGNGIPFYIIFIILHLIIIVSGISLIRKVKTADNR